MNTPCSLFSVNLNRYANLIFHYTSFYVNFFLHKVDLHLNTNSLTNKTRILHSGKRKVEWIRRIPFRVCIMNTLQKVSLVYDEYLLSYSRKGRCPMLRGIICMTISLQILIQIKCLFFTFYSR